MTTATQIDPGSIVGIECRFATYVKSGNPRSHNDLHAVKEVIHLKDGTTVPNLRLIENFKRDYYITKKAYRRHQDKKEWEEIGKLNKYSSTQTRLAESIAKSLETPWVTGGLRKICRSPYVYGADILSTAVIKGRYKQKSPDLNTKYTVAVLDVETDVIFGHEKILMCSLSMKNRAITAVTKDYLQGIANPIEKIRVAGKKYLGEYLEGRNIDWEIVIVDDDLQVMKACFDKAHEWKPDFVAIWNMEFELGKMTDMAAAHGYDLSEMLSDPSIPQEYRYYNYIKGQPKKVTASGKVSAVPAHMRWHTVEAPATFYIIDAMGAYRQIRQGKQEEQSYSLDAILNKELDLGKLRFPEIPYSSGIDWHKEMQLNWKIEYIVYNLFDTVSVELLDEKTTDLSVKLPLFSETSDFRNFKSQPRRRVDALHWEVMESGLVIGTTSDEMQEDADDDFDLSGWMKRTKRPLTGQSVSEKKSN